jgi:hypothetical protein
METVFWALVVGFAVLAFLLYGVVDELGNLRNDVREMKDETVKQLSGLDDKLEDVKKELGRKGTIYDQLTDIEKAILKSA